MQRGVSVMLNNGRLRSEETKSFQVGPKCAFDHFRFSMLITSGNFVDEVNV
jgi:hypothetical protein